MARLIVIEDLVGSATQGRGGHAMYVLQWLKAFESAGHEVLFLEFLKEAPADEEAVSQRFGAIIEQWWHLDRAALIVESQERSLAGLEIAAVKRWADESSAVIQLAAHYRREPFPLVEKVRPRILIEQDPGYTQLWAAGGDPLDIFGAQDLYFTVGALVGTDRCALPTCGIRWHQTWNPVKLDWWSRLGPPARDRFTTVASWRDYGYLEFEGRVLGPKVEEFHKFIDLPRLAGEELEIALNIDPQDPDLSLLRERGWRIEKPSIVSSPHDYRDYVCGSAGEFSCAKGGYVGTRCGWFSDRSACYLAAGRPVVLQSTGFEEILPTGSGLFAVKDVEEAARAIAAIRSDYAAHSAAARGIAEQYFDGRRIAQSILDIAGILSPAAAGGVSK